MRKNKRVNKSSIGMKGEDMMRIRFIDCVKIGFGIYVGYNLAHKLQNSIKLNVNTK